MDSILIRYGEIALKGRNRILFEKKLISNIKHFFSQNKIRDYQIQRPRSRLIIKTKEDCSCLGNIFGITSYSRAISCSLDMQEIKKTVSTVIAGKKFNTFRVTSKRISKDNNLSSGDMNIEIGSFVGETTKKKVQLKDSDLDIGVEIIDDTAYIFSDRHPGLRGLPLGIEGKVVVFVENYASIVAGYLVMKRGCDVILAITKDSKTVGMKKLEKYYYGSEMQVVKLKNVSELDRVADENNAKAVISGQNLKNIEKLSNPDLKINVLKPLIAYSDEEIMEIFKKI